MKAVYFYNTFYFIIGISTINMVNCYVFQVRTSDNQSNVDALAHKVVPAKSFDKIAETSLKHFTFKQYKIQTKPKATIKPINEHSSMYRENEMQKATFSFDNMLNEIKTTFKQTNSKIKVKDIKLLKKYNETMILVRRKREDEDLDFISFKELLADIMSGKTVRKTLKDLKYNIPFIIAEFQRGAKRALGR